MTRKRLLALALVSAVVLGAGAVLLLRPRSPLPRGLGGAIVFVSDRDGPGALYWRRLPRDRERRLTFGSEVAGEPAVSPDGTRVAFSMGGRIAVVAVATGETRVVTLGVEGKDSQPAWLRDGRRLVVVARRRAGDPAGLHLLDLAPEGGAARHPLTQPRAGDDASPTASLDGTSVVFVREGRLFRVSLADGRTQRLTGGFKTERSPRFLPSGGLVCAWSEGKRHGIDVMDADGRNRRTLVEGQVFYRTVAPSPDRRFLVATFTYDLGARVLEILRPRPGEEVHLLDAEGRPLAVLERSWRSANHSPDWGS